MYLLTKLSASQTATWHVYYRIHHTYKPIFNLTIARERHVGPLLKSRKSRQHVAYRSLQTAWCGPERSILKLLHTVPYRHTKTSMILACWRPRWHPRGHSVEVACAMKYSIPVNCPWGSARSVAWPPFTFGCPLVARCLASTYVLPFQSHAGPQRRVQRAMK
jgi:hypothetical protein